MNTQHIETLIIGAGQAGLATGHHLKKLGREFLIVDGIARLGDNWRRHYDSLTLYSPARYDGLPGLQFPGDPWHFPGKEEVAAYLEKYAVEMALPIRLQTHVDRLETLADGSFVAHLGDDRVHCDNVVVATGGHGSKPRIPEFASGLSEGIKQLHSTGYKNPAQLAEGTTLVVGASHSGFDIAHEIAVDRPTVLAGPGRGVLPLNWSARSFRVLIRAVVFAWRHVLTRRTPMGRKVMQQLRHQGAPAARVKPKHLAERGVIRNEQKVIGVSSDGRPTLEDGTVLDVANVIWATGFRLDYDWIDARILGEDGWPVEYRGVVESVPGLYFCGLVFQYAFSSMVLPGVGRDAEYVARRIAARTPAPAPTAA